MSVGDFLKIFVVSIVIFNVFLAVGMPLGLAIGITLALMLFSLCSLNYLNHGKFSPVIIRSSNQGGRQ